MGALGWKYGGERASLTSLALTGCSAKCRQVPHRVKYERAVLVIRFYTPSQKDIYTQSSLPLASR